MGSVAFFLYFGYMGYGSESGVQSIGQTSKVKIIEWQITKMWGKFDISEKWKKEYYYYCRALKIGLLGFC